MSKKCYIDQAILSHTRKEIGSITDVINDCIEVSAYPPYETVLYTLSIKEFKDTHKVYGDDWIQRKSFSKEQDKLWKTSKEKVKVTASKKEIVVMPKEGQKLFWSENNQQGEIFKVGKKNVTISSSVGSRKSVLKKYPISHFQSYYSFKEKTNCWYTLRKELIKEKQSSLLKKKQKLYSVEGDQIGIIKRIGKKNVVIRNHCNEDIVKEKCSIELFLELYTHVAGKWYMREGKGNRDSISI